MEIPSIFEQVINIEGVSLISPLDTGFVLLKHTKYHEDGRVVLDDLNGAIDRCNSNFESMLPFRNLSGYPHRFSLYRFTLQSGEVAFAVNISENVQDNEGAKDGYTDDALITTTSLIVDEQGNIHCVIQITSLFNNVFTPLEILDKHQIHILEVIEEINGLLSTPQNFYKGYHSAMYTTQYAVLDFNGREGNESLLKFLSDIGERGKVPMSEFLIGALFLYISKRFKMRGSVGMGKFFQNLSHQIVQ